MRLTILFLLSLTALAVPTTAAPPHRHLTAAQTRGSYSGAFKRFGEGIQRRDHDVKEVSDYDPSPQVFPGFYVMLKSKRIPAGAAKARVAKYYQEFVQVRRQYYPSAVAAHCAMTVRNTNDEIMAYADEDGAKADTIFYQ